MLCNMYLAIFKSLLSFVEHKEADENDYGEDRGEDVDHAPARDF